MTAVCETISAADLVATANRTINKHWQRPDAPWQPVCADCTDDGCPRLDRAEGYLTCFSGAGFNEKARATAASHDDVYLIDLPTLYDQR